MNLISSPSLCTALHEMYTSLYVNESPKHHDIFVNQSDIANNLWLRMCCKMTILSIQYS